VWAAVAVLWFLKTVQIRRVSVHCKKWVPNVDFWRWLWNLYFFSKLPQDLCLYLTFVFVTKNWMQTSFLFRNQVYWSLFKDPRFRGSNVGGLALKRYTSQEETIEHTHNFTLLTTKSCQKCRVQTTIRDQSVGRISCQRNQGSDFEVRAVSRLQLLEPVCPWYSSFHPSLINL
jgi:hypothetical protein